MNSKIFWVFVSLFLLVTAASWAHPGFRNCNLIQYVKFILQIQEKGVWKIDINGKAHFIPASRFHWMLLDEMRSFAASPKSFGGYFERVNPPNHNTNLILCSDFPLTAVKMGIYTMSTPDRVIQNTKENTRGK
jgi:hypothetical protein